MGSSIGSKIDGVVAPDIPSSPSSNASPELFFPSAQSFFDWNEESVLVLCFGFVRKSLNFANIHIDDIATIIFKHTAVSVVDIIMNKNFSNIITYNNYNSSYNYNYNYNTKSEISTLIMTPTTFDFYVDPLRVGSFSAHGKSTAIFKPFLSTLLNVNSKGTGEIYPPSKINIIKFSFQLKCNNCNDKFFANNGYDFECGLLTIPKKEINAMSDYFIKNENINIVCQPYYKNFDKKMYLDKLESLAQVHNMSLRDIHCQFYSLNSASDKDKQRKALFDKTRFVGLTFDRMGPRYEDTCKLINFKGHMKTSNYKTNRNDNFNNYFGTTRIHAQTMHVLRTNTSFDNKYCFKKNDCIEICVKKTKYYKNSYGSREYILYFIKYNHDGKIKGNQEIVYEKTVTLNFEKFDYLFAFSGLRCWCDTMASKDKNDRGFQYQVYFEQLENSANFS